MAEMTLTGQGYVFQFPEDFDDRAEWEMTDKGYLNGSTVELADGRKFAVFFFDPVRLRQELEMNCRDREPYLTEPGLVVVPEVTREVIHQAIEGLVREGYFETQKPLATVPTVNGSTSS